MQRFQRLLGLSAALLVLSGCGGSGGGGAANQYTVSKLVADTAGAATVTDPNLKNPWGVSFAPGGAFWVSDNGSGLSTLYDGAGHPQSLVVTIPAAGGGPNGPVSGQVYNATADFGGAVFIFDSEDGLITAWSSGTSAVTMADRSGTGAVYKGLAMAQNAGSNFLYAANFNSGMVDVFDKTYALVNSFTDATIPSGFAPFGIANFNGLLYVTFAKQDGAKHDDVAGAGNGYVDVFLPNGTLVKRLASQGSLNSPWGLAMAPSGFGKFGGALLVGNFGDGTIHAFDPTSGASLGALQTSSGTSIVIDGLWALSFGNTSGGASASTLFFSAGPNHEANGLFGSISPS